jgi:hypothetical protein
MKSAQIGFTTYEILKTAHQCKNEGIDILYVLPTDDDVKRFSGSKTNKMIAQNKELLSWTKDKDSIEQKQFGKNTVFYQGSWTARAALMITAKKLVVDEYDRCKQDIVEQYDSRLQSIANPQKAFFSNPSIPDFGIDLFYKKSDQKKWHITHSCGKKYVMDEKCINYEKEIFECPQCYEEITDEERRMGEWISTSTGEWSGYWIPLWIAPWMSAKNIAQAKREKTEEFFANFVAGVPYLGTGAKLTKDYLMSNLTSENMTPDTNERMIIGVDTGLDLDYVMGSTKGLFYHGSTKSYGELDAWMRRWPKAIAIVDTGGDLTASREFHQRWKGRVFLCALGGASKTDEIKWNDDQYTVSVDRNKMIQWVVDEFMKKRIPLQGTENDWYDYYLDWSNLRRIKEIDEKTGVFKGYKWARNGRDHRALATIFWRIGVDRFSDSSVTFHMDSSMGDFAQKGIDILPDNTVSTSAMFFG